MDILYESGGSNPPWPYQTWEAFLASKKEEPPKRKKEAFYPDFMEDVFAGVI